MIKKILSLAVLSAISTGAFAQDTSIPKFNQDFKVSAKIDPGCFLSAENINFGNLITPIKTQSTSSNMKVHCSKGANLSIAIAYDNAQITSSQSSDKYTFTTAVEYTSLHYVKMYKNGVALTSNASDVYCLGNGNASSYIIMDATVASIYGVESTSGQSWIQDTKNICSYNSKTGLTRINTSYNFASVIESGVLKGVNKGEQIKYSLELPNDTTKVWGNINKYQIVAKGVEETISMKANINSSGNPTYRMSPDTYISTLNVILTY